MNPTSPIRDFFLTNFQVFRANENACSGVTTSAEANAWPTRASRVLIGTTAILLRRGYGGLEDAPLQAFPSPKLVPSLSPHRRCKLTMICVLLLAASPTYAAVGTYATWDGGGTDGNWGSTGGTTNWQSGAVPTFGADLNVIFNTPGAGNLSNFIGTSRTIGSLTFNSDAGSVITINTSTNSAGTTAAPLTLGGATVAPTLTVMDGGIPSTVHQIAGPAGSITLANNLTVINPNGLTGLLQISVPINGAFGITKEGTGQLFLNHAFNLYSGKTVVNSGYLRIAGSGSLGHNPATFVADQLILNGGTLYVPSSAGGTTVNLLNRGITLGPEGGSFIMNGNASSTLNGQISGSGNLTLHGFSTPGTLILPQANTFTGQTIINSSILSLTSALALQNSPLNTESSIFGTSNRGLRTNQSNLNLGGLIGEKSLASIFTTSTGGYSGVSTLTLNTASGAEHHYSGIITDGAVGMSLTKTGEGTQILSGANLYSGSTTISNGTLGIDSPVALPTTTNLVMAGGKLDLKGQNAVVQSLNVIAGGSVIDFGALEGGNTLQITNGALPDWTGSLVILHFDPATDALFFGSNAAGINGNADKVIFTNPIGLPEGDYALIPGTDGAALIAVPPSITTQPASQTITSGSSATLTVTATGTEPFTYQWYRGISGDTTSPVGTNSSAFTTPALTASTSFWVKISNSEGSVDSAAAIITTPFISADKVTFNTVGTTTWVCPPGVTSIQVECWGGGGAGGAGTKEIHTATNTSQNGGGGGGGAYARRVAVPVTPGNSYAINIPNAAVSGTNGTTTNGQGRVNGSEVTFVGDGGVTVTAAGGEGGANAYTTINTTVGALAGSGGTSAASLGDLGGVFEGGAGSPGNTGPSNVSGSGGGGAGDRELGGNGFTSTTTPYVGAGSGGNTGGGAGGIGRTGDPPTSGNTNEGAGTPGSTPGGGGGGAKNQGDGYWLGGTGGLGQIIITYEFPTIGYPGNPADPTTGHGAVDYSYKIGRYEVTNAQYAEFLNSVDPTGSNPNGIYNTEMGNNIRGGISYNSGAANGTKYSVKANMGNKPVVYVSWFDAARFTNWLHNGQGIGSTENGAYLLNGATSGTNFTREAGATVWIPNNNEWHKAAYYDPTPGAGGGDNYWFYPTQSDSTPTVATANTVGDVSNPGANVANYNYGADWNGLDGNLTTVGSAAANNYFGTADQAGNAREWTEGLTGNGTGRLYRGGGFNVEELAMQSTRLVGPNPTTEGSNIGFRVASLDQPDALILEFGLPGQPALINHTEGIIIWNVPEGTNVASLAPIYTVSPLAIEDPANPSGSSRDFTTAQTYTITSQNGGSRVYSVITGTPPTITTQPASQSISSGSTATLTVVATGSPAPTYQWYQGISGDTSTPVGTNSASFTTPVLTSSTSYWVKVSSAANPAGVNSDAAAITVILIPPTITTQPASQTITSGTTATLTVAATGDAPLTYQWYHGISGDTSTPVGTNSASFTTPALTGTTSYWVNVSNAVNPAGVDSATATITVTRLLVPNPLPAYDGQPGVSDRPVKVYIMSGDAAMNAQGKVSGTSPGTLNTVVNQQNLFPYLSNGAGGWVTRNDVSVLGLQSNGVITATQSLSPTWAGDSIGPELGFGHVMGWYHDEPVLLIRAANHNRALGWDLLPPTSPRFDWTDGQTYPAYGESPESWLTGSGPSPVAWYAGRDYGTFFLDEADMGPAMAWQNGVIYPNGVYTSHQGVLYISKAAHTAAAVSEPGIGVDWATFWSVYSVNNTVDFLDNFAIEYPQWADQGFEIAGYVWWHGERDTRIAAHTAKYEENMARFSTQLRQYYANRYPGRASPDAPFVLATLAINGWSQAGNFKQIANAQLAVDGNTGNYPEFAGNVKTIEARDYWRSATQSPVNSSTFYNNNAETYMLTGDALGRAMIALTEASTPQPPDASTVAAGAITNSTATINGIVNPNGLPTIARFEYGLTTSYGSAVMVSLLPNDGTEDQLVSLQLTGLLPGVTYHYRLSANNVDGGAAGADLTFTTTATVSDFTPGNAVIYRVGDGLTPLSAFGSAVFLDEYAPNGTLVQSVPMPATVSGGNRRLIASGTATSEGLLSRSADGRFIVLGGYDAAIPHDASLSTTAGTTVNRTVGRVAYDATIDTTTALTDFASVGGPRSAASADGTGFWVAGTTGGIRYAPLGSNSSVQLSSNPTNLRQASIFDGQLLISTASSASMIIGTVGSGLPTTSGQAITSLPGLPTSGSPHAFFLADLTPDVPGVDTIYIADDGIGLRKFSLVAGTWMNNGFIGTNANDYRGLAGQAVGANVTLYATRLATSSSTGGGELVTLTDSSGHNQPISGSATVIATANQMTAFRGVALAPYSLPDLTIEMTAPESAIVGESFDYTITARNIGNKDVDSVNVWYSLPAAIQDPVFNAPAGFFNTFIGGSNFGVFNGALQAGETAIFTITVTVPTPQTVATDADAAYIEGFVPELDATNNTSGPPIVTEVLGSIFPTIITQPVDTTIRSETYALLSVEASGTPAPDYQWYRGTTGDISQPIGENLATLITPPLTANASFWVRVSNSAGFINSDTVTVTVSDITLAPGLILTTYDNTWGIENLNPISNLAAVIPSGQGVQINNINYSGGSFETPDLPGLTDVDNFSILWQGWFDVSRDGAGEYTFGTSSDDGSVIFIDLNNDGNFDDPDELIVNNNFLQAATARVGTVNLPEGKVWIAIGYFEQQFAYGMEARFKKGSGLAYENLDPINGTSGHFFHEPSSLVQPPVIDTHPASQEVAIGTSATLSVIASGVGPFSYQWYLGESGDVTNPVGTNSASFNTGALSADTSFWVRVSNFAGAMDSNIAALTIFVPLTPEIVVEEPIGQSLGSGDTRDFGEAVVGAVGQARTFRIRNQGTAPLENLSASIIGISAVNFTLDASNLPTTLDPGEAADIVVTFQPQLSGSALFTQLRILSNDTTSSPFVVSLTGTAWSPPTITTQPHASQSIIYGAAVTLNVSVSALPAATYQWYQGLSGNTSQPIGGAQLSNFTTPALTASTSYWVRATNAYGSVDSNTAFIEVEPISNNASLAFLSTNPGTLLPAFNSAITNYQLMLASNTASLLVLPIAEHPAATITVNGLAVESGVLSVPIPLVVGDNLISVVVTAQNGETTRIYQITAKRREPMFATTGAATGITQNGATLNGNVIPNGTANVRFQYGTSTAYGNLTPIIAVDSAAPVDVQSAISNLQGGTRYHFRLMADNGVEVVYGLAQTFDTLPGAPLVVTGNPVGVTTADATLVGAVDGRGLETTVKFEYGLTNLLGTSSAEEVRQPGTGYQDVLIPITGLTPNAQYHVRLVATNASGTSYGNIRTFQATATGGGTGSPSAAPDVTTGVAVSITTNSAELRGTVDAKGGVTITYVEFGTTAALGLSSAPVSIGDVDNEADVSLPLSGLNPGTEYHYRIVGQNSLGKTEGSIATFRTNYLPPVVSTGTVTVLTTTSVQVAGTVRASGDEAATRFRYGTNSGNLDLLVDALPASVTGNSNVPVVATLPNLNQGTRYYYRAEAVNSGGLGSGSIRSFDVAVLSGLDRRFPDFINGASHQGSLRVDLSPAGIGGWRFAGETTWRDPGSTATGLSDGDRRIEFRPATGHLSPATETLTVESALGLQVLEKSYSPSAAPGSGTLRVLIKPESIISSSIPPAERAEWRLAGEIIWRDSTDEATGLVPGNHIIEMKPLAGYETPSSALAVVVDGQTTLSTVTYYLAADPVGVAAIPVPFATVSGDSSLPFGFVGQMLSDVGAASGFVVKPRVVATAGHVVFDDGTLAASTGLKWLFQREVGVHEPVPITPRGFYLLSGYAAQRAIDNSPGVSSPDAQNLDAAAVYFATDAVGRNGYSGFLASDLPENEFLISDLDKTLVGYPVEAVLAADVGKMHATPAANVDFNQSYLRTYATDDIRGSGGISGGPLFVRNDSNVWYPAAIFLGGTRQTIVRAIDSEVANLFGFAEVSAAVGGSTGGSSVLGASSPIDTPDFGALRVLIEPAAARNAGARWRINSGAAYQLSGAQLVNLTPNTYTVQLSTVPGFLPPTPQQVTVIGGELSTLTFTYEEIILAPVITSSGSVTLVRGQSLNYQITTQPAADAFTLFGALPTGVAFNASTGLVSGIPQSAGVFVLQAGATNSGGSGTKTITLTSLPLLSDQSATATRGESFSHPLTSGESGDVTWSATNLPDGLSINSASGVVSGVPVFAGNFTSTISITVNGATATATWSLTILGDSPVFTLEPPATRQIEFATGTTFLVNATGQPAPTYQWYSGSTGNTANPVAGATSATFTTPALTAPTSYWVRATNLSGSVDSSAVSITLTPSINPELTALDTNLGSLIPLFSPTVSLYRITVAHTATSITVRPTARVSQTTITVNATSSPSGIFSAPVPLAVGINRIDVLTTAGDGVSARAYAIDVTRLSAPTVVTDPATQVGFQNAQLNGRVTPNGSGQVFFEYGLTEAYGQQTPRQSVSGDTQLQVNRLLGGLVPEANYHFRLVLENSLGVFEGTNQQFFTAPRPPTVATGTVFNSTSAQAELPGAVNPNGRPVTVWFEYGLSSALGASTATFHPDPNGGTSAVDVSFLLTGLIANNVYHYRLVAQSDAGISRGRIETFVATNSAGTSDGIADSPPTMATSEVDDATTTTATLRGTVIPNDGSTEAWFEYGTSETLGTETSPQLIGNGNQLRNVTAPIEGLEPDVRYYFRIAGRNSEGTRYGQIKTFTTIFNPPIATIATVEALSSTSVRITGSVDPRGASAVVDFLYGTDGTTFPFGVTATESPVTVNEGAVSVVLVNLQPSVTYHAVIEAVSIGGTSQSEMLTFQPGALMGLVQEFPQPVLSSERSGETRVDILPAGMGAWRFTGETLWRQPGAVATGLTTADRVIEFMPVIGYNRPPDEPVSVISGGDMVVIEALYYPAAEPGLASLTVRIEPSLISDPARPVSSRAQWRFAGMVGDPWKDSGVTVSELPAGTYIVESKPIAGSQTPTPRNITLGPDDARSITLTYFAATAPMLNPPGPVSYQTAISNPALPNAYVGQVRGDVGSYSGFAVKRRVVATAAQAVFDEATLALAENLEWLWLPDRQEHVPKPIKPRGVYIFDGYASQRTTEASPGTLSSISLNLNIAALYFSEDAARGGESGFLASDSLPNPHLISAKSKILSGYPTVGVSPANLGRLHATNPSTASYTWLTGMSFDSSAIRGFGGMAGGPLSVQPDEGAYYPAGIYVGGTNRGVVRAIDTEVIDLFSRAETSANGGDNNVSGGITHSSFTTISTSTTVGAVRVFILPSAAVDASAGWRLSPTASYRTSGNQLNNLTPGSYYLYLRPLDGFPEPPVGQVFVEVGKRTDITFDYSALNTPPTISTITAQAIAEDQSTGALPFLISDAELDITRSSSNTALVPNANIVIGGTGTNRTVTVTPAANQFGAAVITLTVSDGPLTASTQFTLTVSPVNDPPTLSAITNQTLAVGATSAAIGFTISDLETAASLLTPQPASSNPSLLPTSAISFGGSGANRTLTLSPLSGQLGSTTVTVSVSDGELSASREFILTVTGTALETWRFANFGSTHAVGNAADDADYDGDGATNIEEYNAGTDPKNSLDVFRVISSSQSGNTFSVVILGKPGRDYSLQRAPTLSGPWQNITSSGVLVDQREVTLNDNAALPERGFYRVATSANP